MRRVAGILNRGSRVVTASRHQAQPTNRAAHTGYELVGNRATSALVQKSI
jgi:hypothetical protein